MDEHPDCALHYGHVGRAVYIPESKAWTFSRSFARPTPITYTGITTNAIPSPHNVSKSEVYGPYGRPPNQRLISYAHPDLAAHWVSIHDDALSNFVSVTSDFYDPQVSTLLDLGSAWSIRHFDMGARVSIAAAVTGDCSTTITFRLMRADTVKLTNQGLVRAPAIGDSESTEWSTQGARIRQICFARPVEEEEEGATWMAARLTESTVFFRPLYRQNPAAMHIYHDDPAAFPSDLRNSRLDANPTVEIFSSYTGGFPHADVSFNPWWQRQVAIVDSRGNWSIWIISGKLRKANWLVTPGQKGSLPILDSTNANSPRHDGWASIEWVADFSTILVADRRCAMLFQMVGEDTRSSTIELCLGKPSEWILDMQRSSQNPSHFFILTTTRLLWFDVAMSVPNAAGVRPPLRPHTAWCHFRDVEDTTLRISELLVRSELHLVLYSRVTEVVQVFPCPVTTDEGAETVAVSDPFLLSVPSIRDPSAPEKSTRYSTFIFKEVGHSPGSALVEESYSPNMTLVKLFWIDSSLAIHETFYKGPDKDPDEQDTFANNNSILHVTRHYLPRKEKDVADDSNFVVDDWDDSVVVPRVIPMAVASTEVEEDLEWTVDFSRTYNLAVANITTQSGGQSNFTFDKMIDNLKSEEDSAGWRASESILEQCGGRPILDDIDQNSQDLEQLVSMALAGNLNSQGKYPFMLLSMQFSHVFFGMPAISAGNQFGLNLLETYDYLINEWITSLPNDTPNHTRRMKEKVVRGIALDIILARLIRISNRTSYQNSSQAIESVDDDQQMEEPTTPRDIGVQLSSQLHSSQSVVARDEASQPWADKKATSAPLYYHLSAFTTFKKPRTTARNVSSLLSHWQPGSDPSTYVQQSLMVGEDRTSTPSTPKHRTRKRRSYSQSQSTAVDATSLPPTPVVPISRVWGTQPEHILSSSQYIPSSQPRNETMSQTERGNFGAREVKKKTANKKKRRAAGF
ncbi:hypothetical protein N7495_001833 [Penicillium taxi]|uniref:uncharacterized protein n=1 Tax=Penicillium taxi TaxID=168475 RepID=UPI00254549CE|nr:uncharacterized protein N7495_001833 [Penicillium taxi]KAJ5909151.1 hypothetical protein N7495_001833 [Penicillium taxi]